MCSEPSVSIPVCFLSSADNISSKFQEFTHQLIKVFGQDYIIPDNLAQYYGEYLEDYKALYANDDDLQYPVQCIPQPSKLFNGTLGFD